MSDKFPITYIAFSKNKQDLVAKIRTFPDYYEISDP